MYFPSDISQKNTPKEQKKKNEFPIKNNSFSRFILILARVCVFVVTVTD